MKVDGGTGLILGVIASCIMPGAVELDRWLGLSAPKVGDGLEVLPYVLGAYTSSIVMSAVGACCVLAFCKFLNSITAD